MLFLHLLFCCLFFFESIIQKNDLIKVISDYIFAQSKFKKEKTILEFNNLPEKTIVREQNVLLEVSKDAKILLSGNVIIPIDIYSNNKIIKKIPASVKIRTFDSVFVAKKVITKEETILSGSLEKKWLETTYFYGQAVVSENEYSGFRATKLIASGQPLTLNIIENMPIIKRGDYVKMLVKIKKISVTSQGIAREDGRLGSIINLDDTYSKAKLKGKVIDKETVEILR